MNKKVLITGASGGFGRLIVKTLLQKGHHVAAAMRDIGGRNKDLADELSGLGARVIEIDVTSDESVKRGVEKAVQDLGGMDVLINNAGVGTLGMQEFFTAADFQKLFDINLFGVQRMNRELIPLFRKNKQGLILYTSSLLGRIALPFYGPYQTTKWALEALAENYRSELSGFGIENCIVEPGGYLTTFIDNLMRPSDHSRNDSYGEFLNYPNQMLAGFEQALKANPQQDPQQVAEAVARIIEMPAGQRPFRTPVDFIGMSDHIVKYNEHLEQIITGALTNFGMQNLLVVQKN